MILNVCHYERQISEYLILIILNCVNDLLWFIVRLQCYFHSLFLTLMYFIMFSFSHCPEESMNPLFVFILILFIFETDKIFFV